LKRRHKIRWGDPAIVRGEEHKEKTHDKKENGTVAVRKSSRAASQGRNCGRSSAGERRIYLRKEELRLIALVEKEKGDV